MDKALFFIISFLPIIVVLIFGDAVCFGIWYYITIPVVALLISLPFKPKPLFLTGVSSAIVATHVPYYWMALRSSDGLIGLGHLSSLLGLAIGILMGAYVCKFVTSKKSYYSFLIGFFSPTIGFIICKIKCIEQLCWYIIDKITDLSYLIR